VNLFFKNIRIISPVDHIDGSYNLWIRNGRIEYIGREVPSKVRETQPRILEAQHLVAAPGLFDMHVHFRDPGAVHKEDTLSGIAQRMVGLQAFCVCLIRNRL